MWEKEKLSCGGVAWLPAVVRCAASVFPSGSQWWCRLVVLACSDAVVLAGQHWLVVQASKQAAEKREKNYCLSVAVLAGCADWCKFDFFTAWAGACCGSLRWR